MIRIGMKCAGNIIKMDEKKLIFVDIDGTICTIEKALNYKNAKPIKENIQKINKNIQNLNFKDDLPYYEFPAVNGWDLVKGKLEGVISISLFPSRSSIPFLFEKKFCSMFIE